MRYLLLIVLFFVGCSQKQAIKSESAVILIKTPKLKFYDTGFIQQYDDYIDLKIFNASKIVLHLKLYDDEVCLDKGCIDNKEFNKEYLSSSYKDDFLKRLLSQNKKKITFIDRKNRVKIIINKK